MKILQKIYNDKMTLFPGILFLIFVIIAIIMYLGESIEYMVHVDIDGNLVRAEENVIRIGESEHTVIVTHFDRNRLPFRDVFLTFFGTLFFTGVVKIVKNKDIAAVFCDFHTQIRGTGIQKIYPKRNSGGYMNDLKNEIEKLSRKHINREDPIKILGVALETTFGNDGAGVSSEIASAIERVNYNILFCANDNEELKKQYELLSEEQKAGRAFGKMKLIQNIDTTCRNLEALINQCNAKSTCLYYQYDFAPFASMIVINNSIYYTPNMTLFESDYIDKDDTLGYELAFCIERKSKMGEKLEKRFNLLWDDEVKRAGGSGNGS